MGRVHGATTTLLYKATGANTNAMAEWSAQHLP